MVQFKYSSFYTYCTLMDFDFTICIYLIIWPFIFLFYFVQITYLLTKP